MIQGPHTLKEFDRCLEELRKQVLSMGAHVSRSMEAAVNGLIRGNLDLCNEVIVDDEAVDGEEMAIDEIGIGIMMRYNPVATDLRMVLSSMNAARSLERIGDHAVNIARRGRKILKMGTINEVKLIAPLFELAAAELRDAITAYADENSDLAMALRDRDEELDRMYKRLSKSLSQLIEERECGVVPLIHLLFVVRNLERIGDLAVNVGEEVVFIESAEDIRHQ